MSACDRDEGPKKPRGGEPTARAPTDASVQLDGRALEIPNAFAFQGEQNVELILSTHPLDCDGAWDPSTRAAEEVRIWLSFARGPRGGAQRLESAGFSSGDAGLTKRRRAVLEGAIVERMRVATAPGEATEVTLRARLTQLHSGDSRLGAQTVVLGGTFAARGCGDRDRRD